MREPVTTMLLAPAVSGKNPRQLRPRRARTAWIGFAIRIGLALTLRGRRNGKCDRASGAGEQQCLVDPNIVQIYHFDPLQKLANGKAAAAIDRSPAALETARRPKGVA